MSQFSGMMGQEPGAEDMLLGRLEQTREVIEKYVIEILMCFYLLVMCGLCGEGRMGEGGRACCGK